MSTPSRFIILATRRTGSNYLQSLLDSHSQICCAGELLIQPEYVLQRLRKGNAEDFDLERLEALIDSKKYLPAIDQFYRSAAKCDESTVGFRFFYNHLGSWQRKKTLRYFAREHIKIVHLKRRNLLRRYLSLKNAEQNRLWTAKEKMEVEKLSLDPAQALNYVRDSEAEVQRFEKALKHFKVLDVYYEDLLGSPDTCLGDIQSFLGVEHEELSSSFKKLNNKALGKSIENFDAITAAFGNSPWARFLDD